MGIVEGANLRQQPIDNKAHIYDVIDTVSGFHVENGHDIIAIDHMLFYVYAVDERKDAGEETHYRVTAAQFRHQWPLKRYAGCEGHRRQVFARESIQITLYYSNLFRP